MQFIKEILAKKLTGLMLTLCIGMVIGLSYSRIFPAPTAVGGKNEIYETASGYKFINPLLACSDIDAISNKEADQAKSAVDAVIARETANHDVQFVAVYFRDLNNGPWFGINEQEEFIPGSLLKVPLMISVLNHAESVPNLLSDEIIYAGGKSDAKQYFKPEKSAEPGHAYTIENLLKMLVEYSDNNSALLLADFEKENMLKIYADLGIDAPRDGNYIVVVKKYASFFRILFNASYLGRDSSEKALSLLSHTTFTQGLAAGTPKNIAVAHKFGERMSPNDDQKQLHDCGIIYRPGKPYILCVMTRGGDFDRMADAIAKISSAVWNALPN